MMKKRLMVSFALANPILLDLIILILSGIFAVNINSNLSINVFSGISYMIYIFINIYWPSSVCYILAEKLNSENKIKFFQLQKLWIFVIFYLSISIIVLIVDKYIGFPNKYMRYINIIIALSSFIAFYAFLRSCWLAAKFLLQAERGSHIYAGEIFATMLLFIYWPFGIFFLHGRLKRLQSALNLINQ